MRSVFIASMKGNQLMCHKKLSPKKLSQLAAACFAVILFCAAPVQAAHITLNPNSSSDFVSLGDLISGQVVGVVVGDKTFDEFFYNTLQNDMPSADNINVFGFMDDAGNFGLSFHGAFIDLPGGGASDALLRFTVEVSPQAAAQGYRISDAHLFAGGIGVGDNSVFTIDESFQSNNKTMSVYATTLGGPLDTKLSDWATFDKPVTRLRVTKDIFALAGAGSNLPARTTVIDQSFSQVIIPEPASIGLAALAMIGIAIGRRPY